MRLVAVALGAALASATFAPAALGHASFVGGDPAPGTRVAAAPRQVALAFSEPLNRSLSRASLVEAGSGRRVPAAVRFAGPRQLVLAPPRALARGAYRVEWQSVSTADGHPLEGSFGFGVRAAAGAGAGSLERSPLAAGGWARALARWGLYAALLLLAGGLLTRALLGRRWPAGTEIVLPPAEAGEGEGPLRSPVEARAGETPSPPAAGGGNGRPTPFARGDQGVVETALTGTSSAGGVATAAPPRASARPEDPGVDVDRAVAARGDAVLADAGLAAVTLAAVAAALEAALAAHRLSGAALSDYLLANFAGVARIVVVGLAAVALVLLRRAPRVAALAAAAALVAVVASGHARSADPSGVAIVADAVHLLAGAVWLGGAAFLVLCWAPALRDAATRRRVVRTVLPRFGRVAIPAFAVVVGAGVVNAVVELGRVSDLWQTAYGAVLAVKVALVAVAAGLAWLHAYRLRPRLAAAPDDRRHWRALRAEPLVAVGVVAAAALLVAFPLPPRQLDAASRATGALPPCTSCPLPAPAAGELGVAGQAGSQTVAAWIRRQGGTLSGTVRALDVRGDPAQAARLPGARTAACGPGCTTFAVAAGASTLRVEVTERGRAYAALLPARWDPTGAAAARRLVERAQRTMRALRSVVEDERVTSGPGTLALTRYRLRAPDRLAYRTGTGAQSVEIGARQWLRTPGLPWTQTRVTDGLPFRTRSWFRWTPYARSVSRLGERGGVAEVALADPGTPVWARLWIHRASGRVLREQLVAPARLIEHRFHSFDRPVRIVAPRHAIRGD